MLAAWRDGQIDPAGYSGALPFAGLLKSECKSRDHILSIPEGCCVVRERVFSRDIKIPINFIRRENSIERVLLPRIYRKPVNPNIKVGRIIFAVFGPELFGRSLLISCQPPEKFIG
jgi:hypothetical protein